MERGRQALDVHAAVRAGHTVRFLDFMFRKDIVEALKRELIESKPDVVGLSIRNIDNNDYENPVFFIEELKPVVDCLRSASN